MIRPARVPITGPLAQYEEGFCAHLADQGYSSVAAGNHRRLLAHLSRWMADACLGVAELTPLAAQRFLRRRRREGYATKLSVRGLAPLLSYLDGPGVLLNLDNVSPSPTELLLQAYREYLRRERGLVDGSVRLYEGVARLFLSERSEALREDLASLSGADISAFILRESSRCGVAGATTAVCGLRSLLRFLCLEGWVPHQLSAAVPAVGRPPPELSGPGRLTRRRWRSCSRAATDTQSWAAGTSRSSPSIRRHDRRTRQEWRCHPMPAGRLPTNPGSSVVASGCCVRMGWDDSIQS